MPPNSSQTISPTGDLTYEPAGAILIQTATSSYHYPSTTPPPPLTRLSLLLNYSSLPSPSPHYPLTTLSLLHTRPSQPLTHLTTTPHSPLITPQPHPQPHHPLLTPSLLLTQPTHYLLPWPNQHLSLSSINFLFLSLCTSSTHAFFFQSGLGFCETQNFVCIIYLYVPNE